MDNNEQPPQKKGLSWIWWVILVGLILWNVYMFLPKSQPEVSLPYSTFLNQVKAGNVSEVHISGSDITGTFVKPYTPPSTPVATQAPQSTPAATPGASGIFSSNSNSQPSTYNDFKTTFPEVEGDSSLMPLLTANNVKIDVSPPPSPWLSIILSNLLPILLLVVVLFWMGRQAAGSQSGIFKIGKSQPRRNNMNHPQVTFNDVAGVDEAKVELKEVVDFLRNPQKYHKLGARIPRGVLLIGPPGTGKTLLARAVAGEAGVPFFSISASEFVEMFVGVGASRVRDLFEQALSSAPGIVFIDELDAVGRRRGTGLGNVNDEREQTLNQLLVEMDGFDEHHEVIVLAATNRPDVLDPALLRPGRFDRQVTVGLPDRRGREGILRIHTRQLSLGPKVNLDLLGQTTTGFSGADLANLCNEAALIAARENHTSVQMADFENALDRVLLGAARTLLLNEEERRTVAYHESGHALVAWLTPEADPVHKVTIIPRGRALGVTEQLPGDDHYNYSREYLMARLAVMLGGRSAEEIALDDITTGAENDLIEATRLARRMVTRWGMGSIGSMALSTDDEQPFLGYELSHTREYSEETAAVIDRDVQRLLSDRHQYVKHLLGGDYRAELDQLAQALLEEETIDKDTIEKILGPKPISNNEKPKVTLVQPN